MVVSRDLPTSAQSGRERTMLFIRSALSDRGDVRIVRLRSLFERPSLRRIAGLTAKLLGGLASGRPVPLQSLLFWDRRDLSLIRKEIDASRPDAVYFDGVRSGVHLAPLKLLFPDLRMVCDFDDLMSRRMSDLARDGAPVSLGYLGRLVPPWMLRAMKGVLPLKRIPAYEARALRAAEREILEASDAVALVSGSDAGLLPSKGNRAKVVVIPPAARAASPMSTPLDIRRFVFVGSDALLQNRRTIEYLVRLWARIRPSTVLHLYGMQAGPYSETPGVVVHGFVDDVAVAYADGALMLAPSMVAGGVKTKVLEAFSHGVVAVGTSTTFDGIEADTEALVLDEAQLVELVTHPERWNERLESAGRRVLDQVAKSHAATNLAERWREVVWPDSMAGSRDPPTPEG